MVQDMSDRHDNLLSEARDALEAQAFVAAVEKVNHVIHGLVCVCCVFTLRHAKLRSCVRFESLSSYVIRVSNPFRKAYKCTKC